LASPITIRRQVTIEAPETWRVWQMPEKVKLIRIPVPQRIPGHGSDLFVDKMARCSFNDAHSNDLDSDTMISATLGDKSSGFEENTILSDSLHVTNAECCASRA
jgi:hypothetical protein